MKKLGFILIAVVLSGCNEIPIDPYRPLIVFLTSKEYTPTDIGSTSNVDQICKDEAQLSDNTKGLDFIAFSESGGLSYADRSLDSGEEKEWYNFGFNYTTGRTFWIDGDMPIIFDQFHNEINEAKTWSNLDAYGLSSSFKRLPVNDINKL